MISPIELIEDKRDVSSANILDYLLKKGNILIRLHKEQFWMVKLDTVTPKSKIADSATNSFCNTTIRQQEKIVKIVREAYYKLKAIFS
jgi:hypothetical protein